MGITEVLVSLTESGWPLNTNIHLPQQKNQQIISKIKLRNSSICSLFRNVHVNARRFS